VKRGTHPCTPLGRGKRGGLFFVLLYPSSLKGFIASDISLELEEETWYKENRRQS